MAGDYRLAKYGADQREKVQFTFAPQKAATSPKVQGGVNQRMNVVGEQYGQSVRSNFPVGVEEISSSSRMLVGKWMREFSNCGLTLPHRARVTPCTFASATTP